MHRILRARPSAWYFGIVASMILSTPYKTEGQCNQHTLPPSSPTRIGRTTSPMIILDLLALIFFAYAVQVLLDRRNVLDIPKESSWFKYTEMGRKYGEIMSFQVFGQMIIVLNSSRVAKDLLEKRGNIYSDRPVIPFLEMLDWGVFIPNARYSDWWRQSRKILDRGLGGGAASKYRPMQHARVRVLLGRLLNHPENVDSLVELLQGELILAMTYGYEVKGEDDRKVTVSRDALGFGSRTALPGALLVNHLPILRHIPEKLSWFSYKPLARFGRDLWHEVMESPIQIVKDSMENGSAVHSLALENLQNAEKMNSTERAKAESVIVPTMGSMYAAGVDTTTSALLTFLLAMILHPDVQVKAQAELDSVVGRDRLPTFEDRPRLPYIDALCREVLRWKVVTPLAVPHATTEDNVYEGFFIPKGVMILANVWAILQDPITYPEPSVFKPERFLTSDGNVRDDPTLSAAFGFGKRICPGRHFVDATLFIAVASMLSVFRMEKKRDAEGNAIPIECSYSGSVVSSPSKFPCSIVPRDARAAELISIDIISS
ncbi:cytochrome P450 [Gloeopeniophorella convolvens]|nr:cytochrome P450 [Gloeopeniophorella convolvens]